MASCRSSRWCTTGGMPANPNPHAAQRCAACPTLAAPVRSRVRSASTDLSTMQVRNVAILQDRAGGAVRTRGEPPLRRLTCSRCTVQLAERCCCWLCSFQHLCSGDAGAAATPAYSPKPPATQIPHVYRTAARGSHKRQKLFEQRGTFQVPYLEVRVCQFFCNPVLRSVPVFHTSVLHCVSFLEDVSCHTPVLSQPDQVCGGKPLHLPWQRGTHPTIAFQVFSLSAAIQDPNTGVAMFESAYIGAHRCCSACQLPRPCLCRLGATTTRSVILTSRVR